MTFKDFIKSKQLCEMAFNLKEAKTITFLQLDSTVDHLLKVYIGQDLISAQPGKDQEIQIDNFLNKIKSIKLKTSKKNITQGIFRDELTKIIKDCKEDSRISSLTKEILTSWSESLVRAMSERSEMPIFSATICLITDTSSILNKTDAWS